MFAKYQGVFRSRWKALWWAAGVCLTAYCSVPSPNHHIAAKGPAAGQQQQQDSGSEQDEAAVAAAMHNIGWGGGNNTPQHQHKHVNPWALDKTK